MQKADLSSYQCLAVAYMGSSASEDNDIAQTRGSLSRSRAAVGNCRYDLLIATKDPDFTVSDASIQALQKDRLLAATDLKHKLELIHSNLEDSMQPHPPLTAFFLPQ